MPIERFVLEDEPTGVDGFSSGGHDRTALTLAREIARVRGKDYTIGLEGAWGSGKSSVVEIARNKLESQNGIRDVHYEVFCFDIWRSQGAAFRRSFLENFLEWSKSKYPTKVDELVKIEKLVASKQRKIDHTATIDLGMYGVLVLLCLPMVPFFYILSTSVVKSTYDATGFIPVLYSWPALVFYFFVAVVLVKGFLNNREEIAKSNPSNYWGSVSRALLVATKHFSKTNIDESIREVDPNDFEFNNIFRSALSKIQDNKNKVIVVLDNIDRLPARDVQVYWALARSINSGKSDRFGQHSGVTTIIPYDRGYILDAIGASVGGDKPRQTSGDDAFISKTFDEIIFVPPPILSDISGFYLNCMRKALLERMTREESFRSYLVFAEYNSSVNSLVPPRKILSFINCVTSTYLQHDGRVSLPTVTLFECLRGELTAHPMRITDQNLLTEQTRLIVGNGNLECDLARLTFNVDEELARQVLIDRRISEALVRPNMELIEQVATQPGFEERLIDVFLKNAEDWISASAFDRVARNLRQWLLKLNPDSKPAVQNAFVAGLRKVQVINVRGEQGKVYADVFDVVPDSAVPELLRWYITASLTPWVKMSAEIEFDTGRSLGNYIYSIIDRRRTLSEADLKMAFNVESRPNIRFLYGLALQCYRLTYTARPYCKLDKASPDGEIVSELADLSYSDMHVAPAVIRDLVANDVVAPKTRVLLFEHMINDLRGYSYGEYSIAPVLKVLVDLVQQMQPAELTELSIGDLLTVGPIFQEVQQEATTSPESTVLGGKLINSLGGFWLP